MKMSLPSNLGPRARRSIIADQPGRPWTVSSRWRPRPRPGRWPTNCARLGATVHSRDPTTRLWSIGVPAGQLASVAALTGVVYVDCGERFSR